MKRLLIMRGLPGSGKTTEAHRIMRELARDRVTFIRCSADCHFTNAQGAYTFLPTEIGVAHFRCQHRAYNAMKDNVEAVLIDNTNVSLSEFAVYLWMAKEFGYNVTYLEPHTAWARDPVECAKRTTHGVPLERIQAMAARWDELPN